MVIIMMIILWEQQATTMVAIDATKGKLVPNGPSPNSAQFTTGAKITIPVSGKCTISVKSYAPASTYALYTIAGEPASKDDVTTVYNYEDESEGTVEIVSTGSAYIVSISIVYAAKDVEYNEQPAMPKTYDLVQLLILLYSLQDRNLFLHRQVVHQIQRSLLYY